MSRYRPLHESYARRVRVVFSDRYKVGFVGTSKLEAKNW